MRPTLFVWLFVGVLLLGAPSGFARIIENWPYERLMQEAELVVVAQATKSEDAPDRLETEPFKDLLRGVNTTFEVRGVLKGEHKQPKLTLLHFKLPPGESPPNGPLLTIFRTQTTTVRAPQGEVQLSAPEYLLFLKALPDGRYAPIAGQVDSVLSVREMHSPLPSVIGE